MVLFSVALYDDRGEITGDDSSMYAGLSVGDTVQFYEKRRPRYRNAL